jgi:hypothetical protein
MIRMKGYHQLLCTLWLQQLTPKKSQKLRCRGMTDYQFAFVDQIGIGHTRCASRSLISILAAPNRSRPVEILIAIQNLKQGALIHTLGAAAQALFGFLMARIKYPQKIICSSEQLFTPSSQTRGNQREKGKRRTSSAWAI